MRLSSWKSVLRVCLASLGLAALGASEARADFRLLVSNITGAPGSNITAYDDVTGASLGTFPATNLTNPRGIALGNDGSVYINDINNGNVNKYTSSGSFLGTVATGLLQPHGMAIGPNGNLFVNQFAGSNGVLQITPGGSNLGTFTSGATPTNATGLAFDTVNNRLYVASSGTNAVLIFNATTGASVGSITGNGLNQPAGLFVAPNGDVFVANFSGNNILQFNQSGSLVNTITAAALNGPGSMLLNSVGDLLVVSTNNNQILRFTASGGSYSFANVFATGLSGPIYLALAPVPEPASFVLLGLGGLVAVAAVRRSRRAS